MSDRAMPRYHVTGVVSGSKYLGVFEASSEAEAVEKALESDAAQVSVCYHCASEVEDPEITDAVASPVEDERRAEPGDDR